ncbi:hypothetical protein ACFS25_21195 [Spirosoma flavum]|uniref:Uncharacterized protein n=2 Tax=Spirosoma flavum TaxID=2048557 RepID=A0ABW6ALX3_9BACT
MYRFSDFFFSPIQVRPVIGALFGLVIGSFFSPFGALMGALNGFLLAFAHTFALERFETDKHTRQLIVNKLSEEYAAREKNLIEKLELRYLEQEKRHKKEIQRMSHERQLVINDLFLQFQDQLKLQADLHNQTQREQEAYLEANTILSLFGNSMNALFKVNHSASTIFTSAIDNRIKHSPSGYYAGHEYGMPTTTSVD